MLQQWLCTACSRNQSRNSSAKTSNKQWRCQQQKLRSPLNYFSDSFQPGSYCFTLKLLFFFFNFVFKSVQRSQDFSLSSVLAYPPASSLPQEGSCFLANGELLSVCVDTAVHSYGVPRAKIQVRAGSEPTHFILSSGNWKDLGLATRRWPAPAALSQASLDAYLWGGFIEVTDRFHSSQLPVPILAYKHRWQADIVVR